MGSHCSPFNACFYTAFVKTPPNFHRNPREAKHERHDDENHQMSFTQF
jgi:hypothetical protein